MSVKVALEHRTTYTFAQPVTVGPHVVRLRPAPHAGRRSRPTRSTVSPTNHFLNWQQDPFGNWLARLVFPEKVERARHHRRPGRRPDGDQPVRLLRRGVRRALPVRLRAVAGRRPGAVPAPGRRQRRGRRPGAQALPPLPAERHADRRLPRGAQRRRQPRRRLLGADGARRPDARRDAAAAAIGSCRDSAWLLVSLLRQYGLAARFVSGYLVQLAADPDAVGLDGPTRPDGGLHRPARLGRGLRARAPAGSASTRPRRCSPARATSRCRPRPHPSAAAPIEGATDPVEVTLRLPQRGAPDPRGPAGHQALHRRRSGRASTRSARRSTQRLRAGDVRLTMGGEPTFVSRDDTTSAAVEHRRRRPGEARAGRRARRAGCARRTPSAASCTAARASGTRASRCRAGNIALQWRTDGVPLWQRPGPVRRPVGRDAGRRRGAPADAEALARRVTEALGPAATSSCAPAYEDPLAALAAEVRQPEGERPATSRRPRTSARARRATSATPAGWVLPHRAPARSGRSPAWRFRRGRLVLIAGHVAGRAAAAARLDRLDGPGRSPASRRTSRPDRRSTRSSRRSGVVDPEERADHRADLRGARRARARLPAADRAARGLRRPAQAGRGRRPHGRRPVVLEGYGPPPDPRLTQLVVTPDPGVIEVNVQPTAQLGRAARAHRRRSTTRRATARPDHREVRPRRPAHRHRRRQPHHPRRHRSRSTRRCCAGPTCWSA